MIPGNNVLWTLIGILVLILLLFMVIPKFR